MNQVAHNETDVEKIENAFQALDKKRLWQRLETLSTYTEPARPWTRRAFSPLFSEARQWLAQQMRAAGLVVRIDSAGNLIGRREGKRLGAKPIMTGSHSDTVFDGGRYDGILGVVAGIELAHALADSAYELEHPLEVVDFLSEEPCDRGISCVGSRAMVGALTPAMLALVDSDGVSLAQAIDQVGGLSHELSSALYQKGDIHAFIELHIEQGPVLENKGMAIGAVTDLVGVRSYTLTVLGRPDHAGTTPMDIRQDALVGAALLIQQNFQQAARLNTSQCYVVATVGCASVLPNSSNAVPGRVEMTLEVRSNQLAILEGYGDELFDTVREELQALGLRLHTESISYGLPRHFSDAIVEIIEQSSYCLGYESMRLPSGAGHDAAYLSDIAPTAMIFVPCLQGRSHCPEEATTADQAFAGLKVLMRSIMAVDKHVF